MKYHLLSIMILFPILGVAGQFFTPVKFCRWVALAGSALSSLMAIFLLFFMEDAGVPLHYLESIEWISAFAISYTVGLDGLNAMLLILVALVFPVLIAYEWERTTGGRSIHAFILLLQSALMGVICAQDLFLVFFFWSLVSVLLYFMISIWGKEGKEKAAFSCLLSGTVGNAFFLMALLIVFHGSENRTFLISGLAAGKLEDQVIRLFQRDIPVSVIAGVLFALGIAVRAPIWPFHGWLKRSIQDGHTSSSVILSGVTSVTAIYLFHRIFFVLFPRTCVSWAPIIFFIGAINAVIGAASAMMQRRLLGLQAYLTVIVTGFCLMGMGSLTSSSIHGVLFYEFQAGIALGAFALFTGVCLTRIRSIYSEFVNLDGESIWGGIIQQTPELGLITGIVIASLLSLPGTGGFVGGTLILIGAHATYRMWVLLGIFALLLSVYTLFLMYQRVFFGEAKTAAAGFARLQTRERVLFAPLIVALVFFGIYPKPLLDIIRPTVLSLLAVMNVQ